MRVQICVMPHEDGGYRAAVPGLSIVEGEGESMMEAIEDVMEKAALYLECKEPEMLEFEIEGGYPEAEG